MRISIQGERGSFHEVAAKQYFINNGLEVKPYMTFDATITSVVRRESDLGLIAIENARSGSILYNYSLLRESGLKILGEHNLRISQNLMALPGQRLSDINEVWSHPVALAQCMTFLNSHPGFSLIESEDTAASAKKISENKLRNVAAIGSGIAASIYNLEILSEGIETYKKNYTRFLVIGPETEAIDDADKASVCFSLGHEPGSLASLLVKLADMNINLSKIQSVPKINGGWEYLFYLDLEFDSRVDRAELISLLEKDCRELEILGLYKKGDQLYDSSDCQ